jgi:hypothetical protein
MMHLWADFASLQDQFTIPNWRGLEPHENCLVQAMNTPEPNRHPLDNGLPWKFGTLPAVGRRPLVCEPGNQDSHSRQAETLPAELKSQTALVVESLGENFLSTREAQLYCV